MSSKFNDLYRSGPGFSSGQISALGAKGSKLDDPDFSLPNGGRGFDRVPEGYQEYLAKKAADAEQNKLASKKTKSSAKSAAKAAAKERARDTLVSRGDDARAEQGAAGAKPPQEGHVARALRMLTPSKKR